MPSDPSHLSSPGSQGPFPLQSFPLLSEQEVRIPTWVLSVDLEWIPSGKFLALGWETGPPPSTLVLSLVGNHFGTACCSQLLFFFPLDPYSGMGSKYESLVGIKNDCCSDA